MRALVLGVGSAGRRHIANLATLAPGSSIVVLERSARPDAIPDGVPFATTPDLDAALKHRVDFAIVSSATAEHIEVLPALIRAGIPLFVEKPVVATRRQLDELVAVIDSTGYDRTSMVGCNLRFLPSLAALHDVHAAGRLGKVHRAHFEAGQWLPDWRPKQDYRESYSADPLRGGGVLLDLIHEIDAARWLLGEFETVAAVAGSWSSLDIRSEDVAALLLSRPGGPVVSIALDYISRVPIRRYVLVGELGTAVWDLAARSVTLSTKGAPPVALANAEDFDVSRTYLAAMQEFVSAVVADGQTSQPLDEGLRSLDLALTAKEAATK